MIFTSFHNEKQQSEIEVKLLKFLVFATVTAKVEAQVAKTMLQGGFSPTKNNLFSSSRSDPRVTRTYKCSKVGDLQFALGFDQPGARLRLTVTTPDGRKLEKEGTSTLVIDVPKAPIGDYEYTITAIQLPNDNYPFTITVGAK